MKVVIIVFVVLFLSFIIWQVFIRKNKAPNGKPDPKVAVEIYKSLYDKYKNKDLAIKEGALQMGSTTDEFKEAISAYLGATGTSQVINQLIFY